MQNLAKKRKSHDEEHIDETWLIPYADLLTLLLALFIVLFASSQVDSQKFQQIGQSLNAAFTGNFSFFENTEIITDEELIAGIDKDKNKDRAKEEEKNKDQTKTKEEMTAEEIAERMIQESQELEQLQTELNQFIQENGLTNELETVLDNQQLRIIIRDKALYRSGSAVVEDDAQYLAAAISSLLAQYPEYEVIVAGHTDNIPISNAQFRSNWDLSAVRALNFMKLMLENNELQPERFSTSGHGEYRPIDTNDTLDGRSANRRVEVSIIRNFEAAEPQVIDANP